MRLVSNDADPERKAIPMMHRTTTINGSPYAFSRNFVQADETHHDAIVDYDPNWGMWNEVEFARHHAPEGYGARTFGVDRLPPPADDCPCCDGMWNGTEH